MCETTDRIQKAPVMVAYLVETRATLSRILEAIRRPPQPPKEAADGPPPIVRHG